MQRVFLSLLALWSLTLSQLVPPGPQQPDAIPLFAQTITINGQTYLLIPALPSTPRPSGHPTTTPSIAPSIPPTMTPTNEPTTIPTGEPTMEPTRSPTNGPTVEPTKAPTKFPTTAQPTKSPTKFPTKFPTTTPTKSPTKFPTKSPTNFPSTTPTKAPSKNPTISPTKFPSTTPTKNPTKFPTTTPTKFPTKFPTTTPTKFPSTTPTKNPTKFPTTTPTKFPTQTPTKSPTKFPTTSPTKFPTKSPTPSPSNFPTSTPTTAAPTRYINPFCPLPTVYNNHGHTPNNSPGSAIRACWSTYDVVRDFNGELKCNSYGCCLCQQIVCSAPNRPCTGVGFGAYGAVGAQGIYVDGNPMSASGVPSIPTTPGAMIDCYGIQSCRSAVISANYVREVGCSGQNGCAESTITVYNPANEMSINCNGYLSCYKANIEVIVGFVGQTCPIKQTLRIAEISFGGQQSGQQATITINNNGCDKVVVGTILCGNPTSCAGTQLIFNGNIEVEDCSVQSLGIVPPALLQCNNQQQSLLCDTMQSCSYQTKIIRNPSPNFMVRCNVPNSCAMLDLTINIDTALSWISGFFFNAPNAAKDANIHILNNNVGPQILKVGEIICAVPGACNGLYIAVGPTVDILTTRIECQTPGACVGCLIKDHTGTEHQCGQLAAFAQIGAAPGALGTAPIV